MAIVPVPPSRWHRSGALTVRAIASFGAQTPLANAKNDRLGNFKSWAASSLKCNSLTKYGSLEANLINISTPKAPL